jgi:hypothetical protein
METVRMCMEGRFGGEASLDKSSVVAGRFRYNSALGATIKASRKRLFALIREMLVVERLRLPGDGEQRTDVGVTGNLGKFIETYSPILQWLRRRDRMRWRR